MQRTIDRKFSAALFLRLMMVAVVATMAVVLVGCGGGGGKFLVRAGCAS